MIAEDISESAALANVIQQKKGFFTQEIRKSKLRQVLFQNRRRFALNDQSPISDDDDVPLPPPPSSIQCVPLNDPIVLAAMSRQLLEGTYSSSVFEQQQQQQGIACSTLKVLECLLNEVANSLNSSPQFIEDFIFSCMYITYNVNLASQEVVETLAAALSSPTVDADGEESESTLLAAIVTSYPSHANIIGALLALLSNLLTRNSGVSIETKSHLLETTAAFLESSSTSQEVTDELSFFIKTSFSLPSIQSDYSMLALALTAKALDCPNLSSEALTHLIASTSDIFDSLTHAEINDILTNPETPAFKCTWNICEAMKTRLPNANMTDQCFEMLLSISECLENTQETSVQVLFKQVLSTATTSLLENSPVTSNTRRLCFVIMQLIMTNYEESAEGMAESISQIIVKFDGQEDNDMIGMLVSSVWAAIKIKRRGQHQQQLQHPHDTCLLRVLAVDLDIPRILLNVVSDKLRQLYVETISDIVFLIQELLELIHVMPSSSTDFFFEQRLLSRQVAMRLLAVGAQHVFENLLNNNNNFDIPPIIHTAIDNVLDILKLFQEEEDSRNNLDWQQ